MASHPKVYALSPKKTDKRKRQPRPVDTERLQRGKDTPDLPLSRAEVCAVFGIALSTLKRWETEKPGFPQSFTYHHRPNGKRYWLAGPIFAWKREHPNDTET